MYKGNILEHGVKLVEVEMIFSCMFLGTTNAAGYSRAEFFSIGIVRSFIFGVVIFQWNMDLHKHDPQLIRAIHMVEH